METITLYLPVLPDVPFPCCFSSRSCRGCAGPEPHKGGAKSPPRSRNRLWCYYLPGNTLSLNSLPLQSVL